MKKLAGQGKCLAALLGLGLGLVLPVAAQRASPQPIPSLQERETPFRSPVDAIIEHVEAGKAEFPTEQSPSFSPARHEEFSSVLSLKARGAARFLSSIQSH